jgi:hypothetical protein
MRGRNSVTYSSFSYNYIFIIVIAGSVIQYKGATEPIRWPRDLRHRPWALVYWIAGSNSVQGMDVFCWSVYGVLSCVRRNQGVVTYAAKLIGKSLRLRKKVYVQEDSYKKKKIVVVNTLLLWSSKHIEFLGNSRSCLIPYRADVLRIAHWNLKHDALSEQVFWRIILLPVLTRIYLSYVGQILVIIKQYITKILKYTYNKHINMYLQNFWQKP